MNPITSERFFFNTKMILNPSIELHSYLLSEVKHALGGRRVESTATFRCISQCSIKNTVNLWGAEPWHRMCWEAGATQPSLSFTSSASPVKGGHTHCSCFKGCASTSTKSDTNNQTEFMLLHMKKYSWACINVSAH